MILTYTFNVAPSPACGQITDVVDVTGQNKAWTERVRQGSSYDNATCNKNMPAAYFDATYDTNPPNFAFGTPTLAGTSLTISPAGSAAGSVCSSVATTSPFGSANPPAGNISFLGDPTSWKNPLPYTSPSTDATKATGLMGQLYDKNDLRNLFAQSYGVWNWNGSSYVTALDSENISAITNICPNNKRPSGNGSDTNCAVAPSVANINLNDSPSTNIHGSGFVNVTFNSQVDPEQSPLAEYTIDWGDGESLDVSGADMNSRPLGTPPHSAYHSYDYYDLLNKFNSPNFNHSVNSPTLSCPPKKDYCQVKPRVKIVDNWGWCSEGGIVVAGIGQPCPIVGYCMNPTSRALGSTCSQNSSCDSTHPVCADGWWEPSGQVTVYKQ
jgi:hypothetical protein